MVYDWAVVGAGPAGIAAVGKLLDAGILAEKVLWVDPAFQVGDFGTKWRSVSSNTKVSLFLKFLEESKAFDYAKCQEKFTLHDLNPEETCQLQYAAEPLQWVTQVLRQKVQSREATVEKIKLRHQRWEMTIKEETLRAKNVVLAVGAEPKRLSFPDVNVISLQDGLDLERLKQACAPDETVAVFGSSHSAIILLRHLLERGVKKVINFYREPLRYAVYFDDWILFDDTGLKGQTAIWAREHIDGKMAHQLERVYSSPENIAQYLPMCQKAIYAVGFQRRTSPIIEEMGPVEYNDKSGIIAPGLFGLGIGFPEAKLDQFGNLEFRVGLWKFMDYLNRVIPVWLKYQA